MIIMLEISAERSTGKFASKYDVAGDLIGLVDGQTLYVEESEYESLTRRSTSRPSP